MKNVNVVVMSVEENDILVKNITAARIVACKMQKDMESNVKRDYNNDIRLICS